MTPALLSAALLLLLLPGAPAEDITIHFKVTDDTHPRIPPCKASPGIILLDVMTSMQREEQGLEFEYSEDENNVPFLTSVNGKARNNENYWEVEVKKPGSLTYSSVLVGSYIPTDGDTIRLTLKKN